MKFSVIELTSKCNLRCSHCYGEFNGGKRLSLEDLDLVIENLKAWKCKKVVLSGGEPLVIGNDLYQMVSHLQAADMDIILTTNGVLVDRYDIGLFKEFSYVQVSIDGGREHHNRIRGDGVYDKVVSNIQRLVNGKCNVGIQMTVSRENQGDYYKVLELSRELGVNFSIERITCTGRGSEQKEPDWNIYSEILDSVLDNDVKTSDPIANAVRLSRLNIVPPAGLLGGCSAGLNGLAISSGLEVYPCVRLRKSYGNLREKKLIDLCQIKEDFTDFQLKLEGKCGSCDYKSICGGCRADSWAAHSELYREDGFCRI